MKKTIITFGILITITGSLTFGVSKLDKSKEEHKFSNIDSPMLHTSYEEITLLPGNYTITAQLGYYDDMGIEHNCEIVNDPSSEIHLDGFEETHVVIDEETTITVPHVNSRRF